MKREYGHKVTKSGKVKVTETPRHLRGLSPYDEGTYTENVIGRRAGEAASAVGAAAWRALTGRKR